jgi:hypothetical protein
MSDPFDLDIRLHPGDQGGETERNAATRVTWCDCVTQFYCEAQRWAETRNTWCDCATQFYCDAQFKKFVDNYAPETARRGPHGFGQE